MGVLRVGGLYLPPLQDLSLHNMRANGRSAAIKASRAQK